MDLGGLSKRVSRFVVCTSSTKNPFPSYVHERPREDPSSPSLLRTASDIYAMAQIKYFNRGGKGSRGRKKRRARGGGKEGGDGDDGSGGDDGEEAEPRELCRKIVKPSAVVVFAGLRTATRFRTKNVRIYLRECCSSIL